MGNDSSKKYLQLFKNIKGGVDNLMKQEEILDNKYLSSCGNCSCNNDGINSEIEYIYDRIDELVGNSDMSSSLRGVALNLKSMVKRLFKKIKAKKQLRNTQCKSKKKWWISLGHSIKLSFIKCNLESKLKEACSIEGKNVRIKSKLKQYSNHSPSIGDLMRKFIGLEAMFQRQKQHLDEIDNNVTNSTPGSKRRTLPLDPPEL